MEQKELTLALSISRYTDACKEALAAVREMNRLGIGQPWIHIESDVSNPADMTSACRIRLEVR